MPMTTPQPHKLRMLAIVPGMLFALIATVVFAFGAVDNDRAVLNGIHHHVSGDRIASAMLLASDLGRLPAMALITAAISTVLFLTRRRRDAALLIAASVGSAIANPALKLMFHRPRPALWISPAAEHSMSFPSGHAMASCTLALAVTLVAWDTRWRWLVALSGAAFMMTVSFSRLYLGVHYPTDVLAGWCASASCVAVAHLAMYPRR